ncbi:MAG: FAD binding domain-containing protein [Candidatus Electryonea clarkiae]|nr:FAD binding domain-containing protein [Candidatus Electryonea clarkiae]MDP8286428.1 FAD binding domain-containing protein [Candidatus Electryonea clarkiae]
MSLPQFDLLVPDSIEKACDLLIENADNGVRIIAGGTDILVDLQRPLVQEKVDECGGCSDDPECQAFSTIPMEYWDKGEAPTWQKDAPSILISLHKLETLKRIDLQPDNRLTVGALVTAREIQHFEPLRQVWSALAEGADSVGSPLVRARGTIGGNICNARPAADMLIPTVGLNGYLTLQSTNGTRIVAVDQFITAPGKTVIQPGEILTSINFTPPSVNFGSSYYKLAQRKALDISVVGVAAMVALDETGEKILDVRVALGAVGPVPILAESVKDIMIGKEPTDELLDLAAKAAMNDARPIDDHRGSAWYRLETVEILTRRMLKKAIVRARVSISKNGGES